MIGLCYDSLGVRFANLLYTPRFHRLCAARSRSPTAALETGLCMTSRSPSIAALSSGRRPREGPLCLHHGARPSRRRLQCDLSAKSYTEFSKCFQKDSLSLNLYNNLVVNATPWGWGRTEYNMTDTSMRAWSPSLVWNRLLCQDEGIVKAIKLNSEKEISIY